MALTYIDDYWRAGPYGARDFHGYVDDPRGTGWIDRHRREPGQSKAELEAELEAKLTPLGANLTLFWPPAGADEAGNVIAREDVKDMGLLGVYVDTPA